MGGNNKQKTLYVNPDCFPTVNRMKLWIQGVTRRDRLLEFYLGLPFEYANISLFAVVGCGLVFLPSIK